MKTTWTRAIVIVGLSALAAPAAALADHGRGFSGSLVIGGRPHYEDRVRVVVEPAIWENRTRQVWVEPVYGVERVEVPVPAVYENREYREWVPPVTEIRPVPVTEPAVHEERRVLVRSCPAVYRVERVLVKPEQTTWVEQPVEVSPGRWETHVQRICVRPSGVRCEERRVVIRPGCFRTVVERVCVRPETRREIRERVRVDGPGVAIRFDKHGHDRGVSVRVNR